MKNNQTKIEKIKKQKKLNAFKKVYTCSNKFQKSLQKVEMVKKRKVLKDKSKVWKR